MANNRMLLFCNVCHPPETTKADAWPRFDDPGILHIMKWYPGSAWYSMHPESLGERMEAFMELHKHEEVEPGTVENPVRLEYETWVIDMPAIEKWEFKPTQRKLEVDESTASEPRLTKENSDVEK